MIKQQYVCTAFAGRRLHTVLWLAVAGVCHFASCRPMLTSTTYSSQQLQQHSIHHIMVFQVTGSLLMQCSAGLAGHETLCATTARESIVQTRETCSLPSRHDRPMCCSQNAALHRAAWQHCGPGNALSQAHKPACHMPGVCNHIYHAAMTGGFTKTE